MSLTTEERQKLRADIEACIYVTLKAMVADGDCGAEYHRLTTHHELRAHLGLHLTHGHPEGERISVRSTHSLRTPH